MLHLNFSSLGLKITIRLDWKAQIGLLLAKKVIGLAEYTNFADVFLKKYAEVLLKYAKINKYAIKPKKNKQSPYRPIYSLDLVVTPRS